ncbi:crossover junction endodeoxyribonuclease RuvC [Bradyrhizobium sp. GM0.4]
MTTLPIRGPVRIIGIDPGLRRTGWGVIEAEGNRLIYVACGSVEPPDDLPLASRLLAIHEGLAAVLSSHKPMEAAVEQTFVNKDGVATLKLGQARGVAMLAPAMFGISVAEYAPNQVKKTVVGAGPRRQAADRDDAQDFAAEGRSAVRGRRRRARHRHHPCPSSPEHRAAAEGGRLMIGKLKGLIDSYGEDFVILDVGGVGYQVHCSTRTLQHLPSPGEAAVLSIETYVREDQIKLFGFRSDQEREWFRLLQTVQGVGAKVALAVLGTLGPSDLANAIALRDKAAVARTPGVSAPKSQSASSPS